MMREKHRKRQGVTQRLPTLEAARLQHAPRRSPTPTMPHRLFHFGKARFNVVRESCQLGLGAPLLLLLVIVVLVAEAGLLVVRRCVAVGPAAGDAGHAAVRAWKKGGAAGRVRVARAKCIFANAAPVAKGRIHRRAAGACVGGSESRRTRVGQVLVGKSAGRKQGLEARELVHKILPENVYGTMDRKKRCERRQAATLPGWGNERT